MLHEISQTDNYHMIAQKHWQTTWKQISMAVFQNLYLPKLCLAVNRNTNIC